MRQVERLLGQLRIRTDLSVRIDPGAWIVSISQGDLLCEVVVPFDVHEWFATVKRTDDGAEVWSDWMEHYGADASELDAERAESIAAFVERAGREGIKSSLQIHPP
jgi:hypothetical protein